MSFWAKQRACGLTTGKRIKTACNFGFAFARAIKVPDLVGIEDGSNGLNLFRA